jgi:hypothetical protein
MESIIIMTCFFLLCIVLPLACVIYISTSKQTFINVNDDKNKEKQ